MPTDNEVGPNKVYNVIKAKQQNEYELAKALLRTFNDEDYGFIQYIRMITKEAMAEIEEFKKTDMEALKIVNEVWVSEGKHNKVARVYGTWFNALKNVDHFLAEHCSDIVRIYGEIVEKAGRRTMDYQFHVTQMFPKFHVQDKEKSGYRKDWQHAKMDPLSPDVPQGSLIWDAEKGGGRRRGRVKPGPRQDNEYEKATGWGASSIERGGISTIVLEPDNTSLWIDRHFGLQEGGTISGTTTDTIFFFNRFGGRDIDPLYHLLPIATIVAGGHHTLVEVALSLSLNRLKYGESEGRGTRVFYSIGMYTTLMPTLPDGVTVAARHRNKDVIQGLLRQYENDIRNKYILVYFSDDNRPYGYYEFDRFDGDDKHLFKLLASTDDNMLQYFRRNQKYMSKSEIRDLIALYDYRTLPA